MLNVPSEGYTENENDPVHSVIEGATKHAVLYSPEQWYSAVRTARKSKTPYHVEELTHAQFIDYKTMSKSVKNLNMDDEGNKVKWSSEVVSRLWHRSPGIVSDIRVRRCRETSGSLQKAKGFWQFTCSSSGSVASTSFHGHGWN